MGPLRFRDVPVFLNPDAGHPGLGSAAMLHARWPFDPRNQRVRVTPAG